MKISSPKVLVEMSLDRRISGRQPIHVLCVEGEKGHALPNL